MLSKVDFTFTPASNQINTTRCNILESGIRAFRHQRFNPEAKLDVVFRDADGIGELELTQLASGRLTRVVLLENF